MLARVWTSFLFIIACTLIAGSSLSAQQKPVARAKAAPGANGVNNIAIPVNVVNPSVPVNGNVNVTNTTPVPVAVSNAAIPVTAASALPVQGTVNASITNSSVPVSGSVSVSNSPNAPLFAEIQDAARSAVGASCDVHFTDPPTQVSCQLGTVPDGKILVIETVTCRANTSIGGSIGPFTLDVGTPGMGGGLLPLYYDLALTKTTTIPGAYDMYALTSLMRVYAASGTGVYVDGIGEKPTNAITGMVCTIAGHLVNE